MKTNVASGRCRRVASSRLSVPLALTVKSVCGSVAAQSCDGCAAVWTTSSMSPGVLGEERGRRRSASRMSSSTRAERRGNVALQPLGHAARVDAAGPKKRGAHVVLEPDHVEAAPDEVRDRLRADQAARARDERDRHAA